MTSFTTYMVLLKSLDLFLDVTLLVIKGLSEMADNMTAIGTVKLGSLLNVHKTLSQWH